jgi:hypothetical protein
MMRKIAVLLAFVLTTGLCNATYTWETWTEGDFAGKDLNADQAFEMTGGHGYELFLYSNGLAIINDTDIAGIQRIATHDQSLLYLNGGTIDMLWSDQGHRFSTPDDPPVGPEHIFMTVRDYSYDSSTSKLTGTWEDNSTFDILLLTSPDTTFEAFDNIAFTIVPEPATLLLISAGTILLRKRKT